jgi:hypothetical protein
MYNDANTRAAVEAKAAQQVAVQEARERTLAYVEKWEAGPCYYTAGQALPNLDDIRAFRALIDYAAPTPAQTPKTGAALAAELRENGLVGMWADRDPETLPDRHREGGAE